MNSNDYSAPDPSFKEDMTSTRNHQGDPCIHCGTPHDKVAPGPCPGPRFVKVKFSSGGKEYTYRAEHAADLSPGQYALTRRNSSLVTVTAIDTEPVPGLAMEKYDWVYPVPETKDEEHPNVALDQGYDPS